MRSAQKKKLKAWWDKYKSASGDDSGVDQSASGDVGQWWHNSLWQEPSPPQKTQVILYLVSSLHTPARCGIGCITLSGGSRLAHCSPMPASGDGLDDPRVWKSPHWLCNHFHFATMDDCCASADYGRMTNVLVAPTWGPSASDIKHFRARHLAVAPGGWFG